MCYDGQNLYLESERSGMRAAFYWGNILEKKCLKERVWMMVEQH